jgi:predicted DNA repair protein MutK
MRVAVLVGIALLMTVGVYGLVAGDREARRRRVCTLLLP